MLFPIPRGIIFRGTCIDKNFMLGSDHDSKTLVAMRFEAKLVIDGRLERAASAVSNTRTATQNLGWIGEDREIPMRVIKSLRSRFSDIHTTQDLLLVNWSILLNEEMRSFSS